MKLTKSHLKQLIKEEIQNLLQEDKDYLPTQDEAGLTGLDYYDELKSYLEPRIKYDLESYEKGLKDFVKAAGLAYTGGFVGAAIEGCPTCRRPASGLSNYELMQQAYAYKDKFKDLEQAATYFHLAGLKPTQHSDDLFAALAQYLGTYTWELEERGLSKEGLGTKEEILKKMSEFGPTPAEKRATKKIQVDLGIPIDPKTGIDFKFVPYSFVDERGVRQITAKAPEHVTTLRDKKGRMIGFHNTKTGRAFGPEVFPYKSNVYVR